MEAGLSAGILAWQSYFYRHSVDPEQEVAWTWTVQEKRPENTLAEYRTLSHLHVWKSPSRKKECLGPHIDLPRNLMQDQK